MSRRGLIVTLVIGCFVAGFLNLDQATPQVRGAAVLPADFEDALVTSIGGPTALAFTPDGRLLITTQGGQLRVYQNGALVASPALNLSTVICSNSERGLLGVAVDPAFATNHFIYLYYTFKKSPSASDPCPTGQPLNANNPVNRVSRFTLNDNNTISSASELILIDNIHSPNGNHNGGDLQFGKDGLLYISVGDGGADYAGDSGGAGNNDAARDKHVLLGKILRITNTGTIPATNPHQGADSGRCNVNGSTTPGNWCREIFATGLRNPFRMAFDPNAASTRFFINDVGQGAWEEVDEGIAGADYGWNIREGHCANGSTSNCGAPPAGLTNPIFDYPHTGDCSANNIAGNSITGGAFVPAGVWPTQYQGVYLFGEFVCGKIFQLTPISGGGYSASVFATGLGSSSAVAMIFGPDQSTQALYYTSYAGGGQVRRIRYTGTLNTGNNLALGKLATQSSTSYNGPAPLAVDGNTNGNYSAGSVTATDYESRPWWQVDLGAIQSIQGIELWNRTDCCIERLSNFYVFVSNQPFTSTDPTVTQGQAGVSSYFISSLSGPLATVVVNRTGRYVRVQLTGTNYLSLAEVRVLGTETLPAPTANNATNVTSTSFTANWSSSSGATGYRLDVSTSNTFSSYVTGYQDLDVGNVLSRSVSGLVAGTAYYYRVRAYNSGATSGNSGTISVTTATQNYTITVSASLSAGGTVSGGGTFAAGSSRTVTATANSGYSFTNWTESGNAVSSSASYSFTLNGNRSLVANFIATPPGSNLALNKPATQSSTSFNGPANLAVDGNTNGNYSVGSVTATAYELRPWWQVDLGASQSIQSIKLWNRTDGWSERLSNFYVFVSDQPFTSTDPTVTQGQAGVSSYFISSLSGPSIIIGVNRTGRYIRVQLRGTEYLSLAEVQVLSGSGLPPNLAAGKSATQSSTSYNGPANLAVDGNTNGNYSVGSVTATAYEPRPWWQVDLGASQSIQSIKLWNRTDGWSERLSNFYVFVSDQPFTSNDPTVTQGQAGVSSYFISSLSGPSIIIGVNRTGRYIRVQLTATEYLSLAEVQVF